MSLSLSRRLKLHICPSVKDHAQRYALYIDLPHCTNPGGADHTDDNVNCYPMELSNGVALSLDCPRALTRISLPLSEQHPFPHLVLQHTPNTHTTGIHTHTHSKLPNLYLHLFSSNDQSSLPKCLLVISISTTHIYIHRYLIHLLSKAVPLRGHVRLHSGSCKRLPLHSLSYLLLHLHSQSPSLNQALPLTLKDELSLPVSTILPLQSRLSI